MIRRRRSHGQALIEQLRRGRLGWLLRASGRLLAIELGRPADAPLFATLAVTYRCNYRCAMCDLPQRAGRDPQTSTLIERLDRLWARGALAVGLTGGEPLLHAGLAEIIEHAHRRRMLVHLNTNGSRLTAEAAAMLIGGPLHSLNISLDGACAATHDMLRGVPGSFGQITETTRILRATRRGSTPRLGLVMAVSRSNFREIPEFLELSHSLGVDSAGFLPHHAFVEHPEQFSAAEQEVLGEILAAAAERTDNSPAYLERIPAFLGGAAMPTTCSAPRTHLAVDPDGIGYPCVPMMTLRTGGVSLEEIQGSADLSADPQLCQRCWWNCHREQDLSIGVLRQASGSGGSWPSSPASPTSSRSPARSSTTTSASSPRTRASRLSRNRSD